MTRTERRHTIAAYVGAIVLCFWLMFLHLVLSNISIGIQVHILLLPFLLRESHAMFPTSKVLSFLMAIAALWGLLLLMLLTLLALIGD